MWEIAVHLAVACDVYGGVFLCCPFSHKVSWMILNLIESVSEGFPSNSYRSVGEGGLVALLEGVQSEFSYISVSS